MRVSDCAVVLGGTLLDNARTFAEVRRLAITDPLTRTRQLSPSHRCPGNRKDRPHRPEEVTVVLEMPLKKVNDHYGHLVGSRTPCRLAETLRIGSRSIDTPALWRR